MVILIQHKNEFYIFFSERDNIHSFPFPFAIPTLDPTSVNIVSVLIDIGIKVVVEVALFLKNER